MQKKFIHVVYFWLKDPDNKEHRMKFEASLSRFITQSKEVLSGHIGTSAGSTRDVVDGSFTYSLHVTFASKEDHDIYQADPAHFEFIEECKDLWEKVQVYDSFLLA